MTPSGPGRPVVLVQGASRGLGLEFARQLSARDDVERIVATCRRPESAHELQALGRQAKVEVMAMDVEREDTIRAVADRLSRELTQLDLLINCAGLLHDGQSLQPEKRLAELEAAALGRSFAVNATGPALVVKHLQPLLQRSANAAVANLSARVGSLGDNRLGGWYAYRASKAAQNMLTRCMAIELGRGSHPVTVVALHPGTVDTDLSRPFQRNVPTAQLFDTHRAVAQLLEIIDGLKPEHSGRFYAWDGSEVPW